MRFRILSACFILAYSSLSGYYWNNLLQDLEYIRLDATLSNGYRQDRIINFIETFIPPITPAIPTGIKGFDPKPPRIKIAEDLFKARNINMYQIGLRGDWTLCQWLLRIDGNYAIGGSPGQYRERANGIPRTAQNTLVTKAHVRDARAQDFSIGLGYLIPFFTYFFPIYQDIHVGPVGGWSYNRQAFKLKHAKSNGKKDPALNNLKYKNLWQSPWLGVDVVFTTVSFNVKTGFEYHWGDWHATWKLAGADVPGGAFSDRRKSHSVKGHVYYAMARWTPWCAFSVGLGFKIQRWKARHGHANPLTGNLPPPIFDVVKHAIWESCSGTIDLSYNF